MSLIRTFINLYNKKPILTIYDCTKLCNQRCKMCNIWKNKSNDLSLEEIKIKAKELHDFGIGYVFIQGGEPTIRKDLVDIIDIFLSYNIKPTVITNGILLNRNLAQKIAERKCNLSISIDSLDSQLFFETRGTDKLDKIIGNIEDIKHLCKTKKGNWSITSTVTKKTKYDDIIKIEQFATSRGFMFAIRPYIATKGTAGKVADELSYDIDDVLPIFDYILKKARKNNYLASLVYEEHINYIRKKAMPMCDAGKHSFFLQENGKLSPCIEYPNIELTLTNYKEQINKIKDTLTHCNSETPCFYNDAREIGILWRNKTRIILNSHKILIQILKYGNFF